MEKIIEPDYSIGSFSFYNSDNMDIMKCYPDNYFDAAINRFKDSSRQTAFSFE